MARFSEIEKQATFYTEHRTKCKCGHGVLIISKDGKQLCKWCGHYVFASPEIEKEYRLKEIKKRIGVGNENI